MTTLTGTVTTVNFGGLEFEGLLLSTGEFAVGLSQLHHLGLVQQNLSQKRLEASLGITFQSGKKVRTSLNPKEINTIGLDDLRKIIIASANKGNDKGKELRDALVGLSLQQVFSDAFGVKFEKDDRRAFLKARVSGKVTRRTLTDAIADWLTRSNPSENTKRFIYRNVTDLVYKGLFGKTAQRLKDERGAGELRDCMSEAELKLLDRIEANITTLIDDKGYTPSEATKKILEMFA
jgi:hypothetical protein